MRKVESRQQGPPAKKAKLNEVLAAHCRADLVTECVKKKKKLFIYYYQVTFVFVFRWKWMSIFIYVSFSAVNGISFSSAFSFTAENEKCIFGRSLIYITKRSWSWSWDEKSWSLIDIFVLNIRLGLGLGLEKSLAYITGGNSPKYLLFYISNCILSILQR